jgi:hypothetical protein
MRPDITAIVIVTVIFGSIAIVIKSILDHRVKMKFIEKGPDGVPNKPIDFNLGNGINSSLKWGLVLVFVGIANLIAVFSPTYFDEDGILGAMLLAAGIALLLYYFIADMKKKRSSGI